LIDLKNRVFVTNQLNHKHIKGSKIMKDNTKNQQERRVKNNH
jgi:hypothetical protein